MLPTCAPEVTITFRVDKCPTVLFADTEVTLIQVVDSVDVASNRIPMVPKMEPRMVVSVRPVVIRLPGTRLDNTIRSYDIIADVDPSCCPAVNMTALVLDMPKATRHRVDESELQTVDSHSVVPIRTAVVCSAFPKPRPRIGLPSVVFKRSVDLEEDGALARVAFVNDGRSQEIDSVRLPTSAPEVTASLLVLNSPAAALHTTVTSDRHSVFSH